jgi:hypothetical protein
MCLFFISFSEVNKLISYRTKQYSLLKYYWNNLYFELDLAVLRSSALHFTIRKIQHVYNLNYAESLTLLLQCPNLICFINRTTDYSLCWKCVLQKNYYKG